MKLKKGDKVYILAGKDKGKSGTITKVLKEAGKIVVEGINMLTKHQRPRKQNEKGVKIKFAAPLPISRAALLCPKCGKATRVGFIIAQGKKFRQCRKCKGTF